MGRERENAMRRKGELTGEAGGEDEVVRLREAVIGVGGEDDRVFEAPPFRSDVRELRERRKKRKL